MNRIFLLLFLIITSYANAQLQSPSEFLGYELGAEFTRHSDIVSYFEHVASQSNKVQYHDYGKTNERRRLTYALISSEENLRNIDKIRTDNLKNAGLLSGSASPEKTIIWLSYNVHGNEASCSEAAMNTIYKLLTEHQGYLENVVVIMDPNVNPDGRDRYVNWYNQVRATPYNASQDAAEHYEPWPAGRPNHYLFDLNRDWAWASQVETQQRLKVYNQWMPQIHVDFHEQFINNPYYFAPGAEPYHEMLTPWQRDFQHTIGKNNAKYFDEEGWLYFTRESFDLLYPSYGDTYPLFNGAIGMTYEQAGHGRAGLGIINDEGVELTLTDRIAHHTTTGLSTIEVASKNASQLNSEFRKFFNNDDLKYKSFVLQGNSDNIKALTELLDIHEISYGFTSDANVRGYHYKTGKNTNFRTDNALVVSTNQPKGKLVHVLFEPETQLSTPVTYDITAWSLAYAFGLDAVASTRLVTAENEESAFVANQPVQNAAGYLSKWNSVKDAQFMTALLEEGIKVRFSEKKLSFGGSEFGRGSLIITRSDNKNLDDFDNKLIEIANKHERTLYASETSYSDKLTDFGSQYVHLIKNKKVAILTGDGISSLNYGQLWHFFENELAFPFTAIHTKHIDRIQWSDYDVLILPEGNYNFVNDKNFKKLDKWVSQGGRILAFQNAMEIFLDKDGYELEKNEKEETEEKTANLIPYAEREMHGTKDFITGSIFKVNLDTTHPLAFGMDADYYSLKLGSKSYKLMTEGYNVGYIGEEVENVSGFAGEEAKAKLKNSIVFAEAKKGRGSVVYFVDDVTFRSFWQNGKLLLINGVFLTPLSY